jgi:hypothetical protein
MLGAVLLADRSELYIFIPHSVFWKKKIKGRLWDVLATNTHAAIEEL